MILQDEYEDHTHSYDIPYRKYISPSYAKLFTAGFMCTGNQNDREKLKTLAASVSLESAKKYCENRKERVKTEWSMEEIDLAHSVKKQTASHLRQL